MTTPPKRKRTELLIIFVSVLFASSFPSPMNYVDAFILPSTLEVPNIFATTKSIKHRAAIQTVRNASLRIRLAHNRERASLLSSLHVISRKSVRLNAERSSTSSNRIEANTERKNNDYKSISDLLKDAQNYLKAKDAKSAFQTLASAYTLDPNARGLQGLFESCLRLRIEIASDSSIATANSEEEEAIMQDRFGLASLLIDQERYDEASIQLKEIIKSSSSLENPLLDKARAMLFRTNAACCNWNDYERDGEQLKLSLMSFVAASHKPYQRKEQQSRDSRIPVLHPFEALKWPCVSLPLATQIAASYATRAMMATQTSQNCDVKIEIDVSRTASIRNQAIILSSSLQHTNENKTKPQKKIRLGYISPDFTSKHPLAFLMQNVFQFHSSNEFDIYIYSLAPDNNDDNQSPEVNNIKGVVNNNHSSGSDSENITTDKVLKPTFTILQPHKTPQQLATQIQDDNLDVMIDLCGYAGTTLVAEIMSMQQTAPVQISYMGFPGSSGAPYLDYLICDPIVLPPPSLESLVDETDADSGSNDIRRWYTEQCIYMPHCYFVNSHRYCMNELILGCNNGSSSSSSSKEKNKMRKKYGLNDNSFVFCCHSRPDKIDPYTFRTWLRALKRVRERGKYSNHSDTAAASASLWLLRSGTEMENNLRKLARNEFGDEIADEGLIFADIAERDEHLKRLGCADLFLDTPAYNAHTLGCDTLYAGVPMISLLRPIRTSSKKQSNDDVYDQHEGLDNTNDGLGKNFVATEKLASRVGASLLHSVGLDELICSSMIEYEELMMKCSLDMEWYNSIRKRLQKNRDTYPLFDTERWVRNLEVALRHIVNDGNHRQTVEVEDTFMLNDKRDIILVDNPDQLHDFTLNI